MFYIATDEERTILRNVGNINWFDLETIYAIHRLIQITFNFFTIIICILI